MIFDYYLLVTKLSHHFYVSISLCTKSKRTQLHKSYFHYSSNRKFLILVTIVFNRTPFYYNSKSLKPNREINIAESCIYIIMKHELSSFSISFRMSKSRNGFLNVLKICAESYCLFSIFKISL